MLDLKLFTARIVFPFFSWPKPLQYGAFLLLSLLLLSFGVLKVVEEKSKLTQETFLSQSLSSQVEQLTKAQTSRQQAPLSNEMPELQTAQQAVDQVVKDLTETARLQSLQIVALSIDRRAGTAQEVPHRLISLKTSGHYPAVKLMLSKMLARHAWLGIKSFNIQAHEQSSRLDMSIEWILYVQD